MNILWITNAPFPEVSEKLKLDYFVKGWVYSSAYELINRFEEINLGVASIYNGNDLKHLEIGNIKHFLVPQKARKNAVNPKNDIFWIQIKKQFNPDIVHIHGSEYPYSFSFIRACGAENVVVSIQGLISVIGRYYLGGICKTELIRKITFRDIIRNDTLFSQHKKLGIRGKYENLLLQNIRHVIGRTTWDKDHVWAINPNANYHFCNETLRSAFYNRNWNINNCERYRIFISQAYYPLKGFHQLLNALKIVFKFFPKTKIYVAGNNYFINRGIKINGYGKYINTIINKYYLNYDIKFTGILDEEAMCEQYLNSHLFISPSAIENSSNSIGEAQLLGVPCIASYVGGTPDLINHGETGLLYRYEEVEMLAASICKIFSNDKLSVQISENSRMIASKRHNKEANAFALFNIYSKIIS